ncbi:MAG: phage shock protein C [Paraglaciecola sp.]|jgi:phage shock protein C
MKGRGELTRDPERGKIAGVCAGLAEYFGIELWLIRILVVTAFFLSAGTFIFVSYIAAWFILDKKASVNHSPHSSFKRHNSQFQQAGKGWHNVSEDEDEKVKVKSKVWQSGEPPKQAFADIKQRFARNEERLRKVETYVTSSEYQLNREINSL